MESLKSEILSTQFNQDGSCFIIITPNGFRIYNTEPYKKSFEKIIPKGIHLFEMLYRTNIMAIIKNNDKSKVFIIDINQPKPLIELNIKQEIISIKLRRDKILITCINKIFLYNISSFEILDTFETGENPKGTFGLSQSLENTLIAFPDKKEGNIILKNYEKNIILTIEAHEKKVENISITSNGDFLASCTQNGSVIRIFNTENGELLQELRKGIDKSEIKCISFSYNSRLMACSTNKGVVHIFSLDTANEKIEKKNEEMLGRKTEKQKNGVKNRRSVLNGIPVLFAKDFFNSEFSFTQVKFKGTDSVCVFGGEFLYIVGTNGKYYKVKIDLTKVGEYKIVQKVHYMKE